MKSLVILAAATLALSACASTDPYSFTYKEVNPNYTPLADKVTLTVRMEPGLAGAAVSHYFILDGVKISQIKRGEQYSISIDPGQHIIGFRCIRPIGTDLVDEVLASIEAGHTYYFKVSSMDHSFCKISPMTR
jgi:hypothetical protein